MRVRPPFVRAIVAVSVIGILSLKIAGVAQDCKCVTPTPTDDPKFKPGQVWSYKTRPGEEESTLSILRIESSPKLGVIIHIRVNDFQFKNCTGGPAPHTLGHAPFSRAAIDSSVVKLLRTVEVPACENGFEVLY